jgi:hypothetical protein
LVVATAVIGTLFAEKMLVAQQAKASQQISITKVRPAPCPSAAPCTGATASQTPPSSISVLPGGCFEARNQTIENLARIAFGFEEVDPTVGVVAESTFSSPDADRFDIDAVADRPGTPETRRLESARRVSRAASPTAQGTVPRRPAELVGSVRRTQSFAR